MAVQVKERTLEAPVIAGEDLEAAKRHLGRHGHVALAGALDPELAEAVAGQRDIHRIFRPWRMVAEGVQVAHRANLPLVQPPELSTDSLRRTFPGSSLDRFRATILSHVTKLGYVTPYDNPSDRRQASDRLVDMESSADLRRERNDPAADGGPFNTFTVLEGAVELSLWGATYNLEPGTLVVANGNETYGFRPVEGADARAVLHTMTGMPANKVF